MPALKSKLTGEALRFFRIERRLTCQEMAETFGVSRSCYTHWERGEAPISMHAERAIENWKAMVAMGKAILKRQDNGARFLTKLGLFPVVMAEIMRDET